MCICCLAVHIIGIEYIDEPLPHDILSCGIFVCFLFHSLMGCVGIFLSVTLPLLLETIVNSTASVLFMIPSILSMVYVENDEHLQFLTDSEEFKHPFFIVCRRQSICALATSILFAMHSSLGWDKHFIRESIDENNDKAVQPIRLHCLPFRVCLWLRDRTENARVTAALQRMENAPEIHSEQRVHRTLVRSEWKQKISRRIKIRIIMTHICHCFCCCCETFWIFINLTFYRSHYTHSPFIIIMYTQVAISSHYAAQQWHSFIFNGNRITYTQ